ncbi:Tex family protein [Corynebacterium liangguodongii]|uniref:RNA-binding transcriptional accessory protein n=1 Tax=Corynebacterium liangguodongii TaxID=2079535 RepID=A0A2S0WES1_9CORY|nr:Tex family protein [Corynebacterium liangguodongii]AWB84256.1 RNA-binding transcriptional accessory protein [Corynebacterium liangguodongii]PWC00265.1 RNA-binding transcriptional accessory protein [Corynebacterium liangguodongii]
MTDFAATIATELSVRPAQVGTALQLLAEGNTVPFISRYRKEATGGLDDNQLRHIEQRHAYLVELEQRREAILSAIEEQGALTDELRAAILRAETKARLEDLYLPYKKRRKTKADAAREAGLGELTQLLIDAPSTDPEAAAQRFITDGYADTKAALDGARAILADDIALDADLVGEVRERFYRSGTMRAGVVEGKESEGANFKDYFDFSEPFDSLPSHRILALLRGESEGVLALDFDPGEDELYTGTIAARRGLPLQDSAWLAKAVGWAWRTKLKVSATLDTRMRLKEKADAGALEVFSNNLRDVLLAAPAGERATLALDPGYRNGVKCAVVDSTGKVVDTVVIYPHKPQGRWEEGVDTLAQLAAAHDVELIAVGNGTASRETDKLAGEVADRVAAGGARRPTPVTVSESGASVYSASELAAAEFPELDVSLRSAVSIGRRLQDPLAELVKVDPKSIGVGQYQHDVDQHALATALDAVVEDAVNAVGVDLNTASVPLLERVAGITPTLARNIVDYRDAHGAFTSRKELGKVPRLGPKAFEQAAGFLRIRGGLNPLDASAVHPEAYEVVERIASATGLGARELIGNAAVLRGLDPADFATEIFGVPTVTDIIAELDKPGRDPRPEFKTAAFKEGINEVSDLTPGMILEGTVTNVAAFGAFVDIGVHHDGLVHVSEMSERFVSDPREVVRSGDVVKVRVVDVDTQRHRIGLSLRLDAQARKPARRDNKPGGGSGKPGKKKRPEPGGAMAQALKEAGFGARRPGV